MSFDDVVAPARVEWRENLLAGIAIALPLVLGFNLAPSATLLNQAAAGAGWGAWIVLANLGLPSCGRIGAITLAFLLALTGIVHLATPATQPDALALSMKSVGFAAAIAAWFGIATAAASRQGRYQAFTEGIALAALLSVIVGLCQVFAPSLTDGAWIARTSVDGRAVGNLRQPNHLCSLLLWGIVAVIWLVEVRRIRLATAAMLAALMLFVVVLSGSRTGAIGAFLLAVWGVLDKRLERPSRAVLTFTPLLYGLVWFASSTWANYSQHAIGAASRFTTGGDISSSRFAIWSNTLDLIRAHPWFGVGFGEFNFAWTLTEFPNRPTAFFDHTHNLPLQFAVELGLPLAAVLLGLLGWGLWRAWRNCLRPQQADAGPSPQRAAFVMLVLILVHSLLEYPLWYAYFLLPTAFLFGLCLATPGAPVAAPASAPRRWGAHHVVRVGAALMMLGALYSVYDYLRVAAIFAPPANAAPLEERISIGQRSLFFSHHADYAAATTSDDPAVALPAAQRAAHYLLDTRLMMAWANALHASGDSERAKYLAQRLLEFRNPMSEPFFAPCHDASLSAAQRPYQCFAPQRRFTFRDFR